MADLKTKLYRGIDPEDGEPVIAARYLLPTGDEGVFLISYVEVLGVPLDIETATDEQILDRVKAYTSDRMFVVDLMNEQHYDPRFPGISSLLDVLHQFYEGEIYYSGISSEAK